MDDIVRQAMAKWPNVPHCYGWLALDARGNWRMRDERAQALKLPGDRIGNAALLGFINRNYLHDERGRWYFQNGPQRVYVNLDVAPYIARTEPQHCFVLHTGEPLPEIDAAWMTEGGQLLLKAGDKLALVDDRDMAQCLPLLKLDGAPAGDEDLLAWLEDGGATRRLALSLGEKLVGVEPITCAELPSRFGFVTAPQPD